MKNTICLAFCRKRLLPMMTPVWVLSLKPFAPNCPAYRGKYERNLCYLLLPIVIVYVFLQKYIISGVVAGAVKG